MLNPDNRQDTTDVDTQTSTAELVELLASFSHRLFQAHSAFGEARIDGYDITLRQFVLLRALSHLGSASQRELTDTIGMDRSTLSDVIKRLSSNGLILQEQSKEDARAKVVSLTDLGRKTLRRTAPVISEANQQFFGVLDQIEMEALVGLQARLLRQDSPLQGTIPIPRESTQTAGHFEPTSPSAHGNDRDGQVQDNSASLDRLQRARIAFDADLITVAEFDAEKRRYLEGGPD